MMNYTDNTKPWVLYMLEGSGGCPTAKKQTGNTHFIGPYCEFTAYSAVDLPIEG